MCYDYFVQKGFAGIIILVVVLILAGGVYYVSRKLVYFGDDVKVVSLPSTAFSTSPVPNGTGETVYTEQSRSVNWKTYTNSKYKYEVKYPSDWEIVDVHTTEKVTFGGKGSVNERPPLISIHVFETTKFRTQDIPNYTPFDYKIIEKDGYTFFIVASTYQIGAGVNKETEQEAKIMLTKILSTFKFLP